MYFKNPEFLYALLLLIIPIIVHLFELRRFQKEDFTNVKFLQKISRETRKSSKLKKWLVLAARILGLTAIIIAFAQPYLPAPDQNSTNYEQIIYLDNSYSMQANGKKGTLLQGAVQELLESLDDNEVYSLITNNSEYIKFSGLEIKEELQELDYTSEISNFKKLGLKLQQHFKNTPDSLQQLLLISDFQKSFEVEKALSTRPHLYINSIRPSKIENLSIDNALIEQANLEDTKLKVQISSNSEITEPVSLSLFNGNILLAKTSTTLNASNKGTAEFQIQETKIKDGLISIEDAGLSYDDKLYFSISNAEAIKVVAISEVDHSYLQKIFTQPKFQFSKFEPKQIDFNQLSNANLIVLNEIKQISSTLAENLKQFLNKGTRLLLIPSEDLILDNYNSFLQRVDAPIITAYNDQERLLTEIVFEHPLYETVFEKEVYNFDYPKVQSYFSFSNTDEEILLFEDDSPLLFRKDNIYIFTSSLNLDNSNFQRSPLIVPTLFNIGLQSLATSAIYYEIGTNNTIDVPIKTGNDAVLHLKNQETSYIPMQQALANKVVLQTDGSLAPAGNFEIQLNEEPIGYLSFNYNRDESNLNYANLEALNTKYNIGSIKEYFQNLNAASKTNALWKWFVIFALICLTVEMLLLKLIK